MTETTANIEKRVASIATFLLALAAAPATVAIAGMTALVLTFPLSADLASAGLVLLLAPVFGVETYVLFGAPLFALYVWRYGPSPLGLAVVGLLANLLSIPWLYADATLAGNDGWIYVKNVAGLGCFVAPIWAGLFGVYYRWFAHD